MSALSFTPSHPDARATGVAGNLIGDALRAYVMQHAAAYGLDPLAALAVAPHEGGLNGGEVGDNGTSFGPWQLHKGGALPSGVANPQEWANSAAGVDYALRQMGAAARGLKGSAAVEAIVRNFERPASQYLGGEIQSSQDTYRQLAGGAPAPPAGGSPAAGSAAAGSTPQLSPPQIGGQSIGVQPTLPIGGPSSSSGLYKPSSPDVRGFLQALVGGIGQQPLLGAQQPADHSAFQAQPLMDTLLSQPQPQPSFGARPVLGLQETTKPVSAPTAAGPDTAQPGAPYTPRTYGHPDGKTPGVTIAGGADRPGAKTSDAVVNFVSRIAAVAGSPLTITTGTNHHEYARPGHVSDHWAGHAADIAATGNKLTQLGQAALIAAGGDPAWARKQQGGVYNVNGHQIIFNVDLGPNGGGNHWNHLHISAR